MKRGTIFGAAAWAASILAAFWAGTFYERGPAVDTSVSGAAARPSARDSTSRPGSTSSVLSSRDPAEALAGVQGLLARGSSDEISRAVDDLAASWQPGRAAPVLQLFLQAWGRQSGSGAIAHIQASSHDPAFQAWALDKVMEGWARADPAGALAWAADTMRPSASREAQVLVTAIRVASQEGEREAALTAAAKLPAGGQRDAAMDAIASALIQSSSVDDISLWLAQDGTASALADDLLRPVARHLLSRDPQQAADWAAGLTDPNQRAAGLSEVASVWSSEAPEDAAAWAASLAPGDARSEALGGVVRNWARQDITAVGEWLNALPPAPDVDRAVAFFVSEIAEPHPEIAAEWADSISDPHAHRAAVMRVANFWRRTDPEAALRWRSEALRR